LQFVSGIVKIAVASTPQAFGTDKICNVWDKEVTDLKNPVVMKMPVKHLKLKGKSAR